METPLKDISPKMPSSSQKTGVHPRTPNCGKMTKSTFSVSVISSTSSGSSHNFTNSQSPPPKRFHSQTQRVRNPFEAALAERLHLPLIASPSLFQRPATPQLSSTQFEWTIEDVSILKPAHVEPHETQFQDSPDPEFEAKAQSAISSYFKEHQIVPSPVNCSLRQQRIILAEINGNTPIAKPGRRIRDYGTQTILTLPPDLPSDVEEILRPYFQPHLAGGFGEETHPNGNYTLNDGSMQSCLANTSMRRKLFDMHNIIVLDESRKTSASLTPQAGSPLRKSMQQQQNPLPCRTIVGKLSDSLDKSSVGSLSPILASECLSGSPRSTAGASDGCSISPLSPLRSNSKSNPSKSNSKKDKSKGMDDENSPSKRKQSRRSFLFKSPSAEELSPILPPTHRSFPKSKEDSGTPSQDFVTPAKVGRSFFARRRLGGASKSAASTSDGDGNDRGSILTEEEDDINVEMNSAKFTPDRSSSPLHLFHSNSSAFPGSGSAGATGSSSEHCTTLATESFHLRISRLAVNSSGTKLTKSDTSRLNICQMDTVEMPDIPEDDDAMQVSQLSLHTSNLSSGSINSHCDTPTGKRRTASRKNLSQSFSANWNLDDDNEDGDTDNLNPATDNDENMLLVHQKERLNDPLQEKLSKISEFMKSQERENKEIAPKVSNEIEDKQNNPPYQQQQQQHTVNFYRTDSGFNEMTTSSSSTALLLFSQQDELSREACADRSSRQPTLRHGIETEGIPLGKDCQSVGPWNSLQQQQQQHSVNFYRADSGFNEMTTSSSSTAMLLLSQQDELSREGCADAGSYKAEQYKLSEMLSCHDESMSACCSTPSKRHNEIGLSSVGEGLFLSGNDGEH